MPTLPAEEPAATLHLNIRGIRAPIEHAVARGVHYIALALRPPGDLTGFEAKVHDGFFGFGAPPRYYATSEAMVEDYRRWVTTSVFRDLVEAVGHSAEEARKVLCVFRLREQVGDRFTVAQYQEALAAGQKQFHKDGLPHKFEALVKNYGLGSLPSTTDHVRSLNVARNCLVHRQGVVRDDDLTVGARMVLRWRQMEVTVRRADGRVEPATPRIHISQGEEIGQRAADRERAFELGEKVVLAESDMIGVCFGLSIFAVELAVEVEAVGIQLGFVQPPPQDGGP